MEKSMLRQFKKYMLENWQDHTDPITDELNTTSLAEDAWWYSGADNGDMGIDVPEEVFELALVVEKKLIAEGLVQPVSIALRDPIHFHFRK